MSVSGDHWMIMSLIMTFHTTRLWMTIMGEADVAHDRLTFFFVIFADFRDVFIVYREIWKQLLENTKTRSMKTPKKSLKNFY